jgi:arsenate reductase
LGKRIKAYSAGSAPSGRINPFALEALSRAGIDTSKYRSKSWDEFCREGAPPLSIVITVCDSAAAEQCPVFFSHSGHQPVKAHWGYPDPSNAIGDDDDKRRAFELTRQAIGFRMLQLLSLPLENMDRQALQSALVAIGRS